MDTTKSATSHPAWEAVLDALERELHHAIDADAHATWSPPVGLGTLPPELLDRAERILEAQRELLERLNLERGALGRHLTALRTVPAVTDAAASVYLDVAG